MDIENQEVICCADDGEYRIYRFICKNLSIERLFESHLK